MLPRSLFLQLSAYKLGTLLGIQVLLHPLQGLDSARILVDQVDSVRVLSPVCSLSACPLQIQLGTLLEALQFAHNGIQI